MTDLIAAILRSFMAGVILVVAGVLLMLPLGAIVGVVWFVLRMVR